VPGVAREKNFQKNNSILEFFLAYVTPWVSLKNFSQFGPAVLTAVADI